MFVFICAYTLQIYHGSASVLWLFTEKGLIVHVPTDCAAVTAAGCRQFCFSMKPLLLLHKPLLQTQSIYFSYHYQFVLFQLLIQQWSVPLPPRFLFWHKGLNLESLLTALIHWNLHILKQRLFVLRGFGLHLTPSLLRGDSLNWHWRQWVVYCHGHNALSHSVMLTLALKDLPRPRRQPPPPPAKKNLFWILYCRFRSSIQSWCLTVFSEVHTVICR